MPGKKEKKISLPEELKKICLQTGKESYTPKMNLLCQLLEKPPRKPSEILQYHDCLLAMLAYPSDRQLYLMTLQSLNTLIIYIKKISAGKNNRLQYTLSGTGLSGSSIIGSFSFEIAKWLSAAFPHDTEIESSLADPESVRFFFREILPRTEYENIFTGELNLVKRSLLLKGKTSESVLSWLLHHIDILQVPERDKESIFHNLQIFLSWKLNHSQYNRTFLKSSGHPVYYHKSIIKRANIHRVVNKPLPDPVRLTRKEQIHLINTARATLIFLHRETEPFTYADPEEITRFDLERGFSVVLYGMSKDRRLSIESYIGYLAFKNHVPVAYGGGWIFGHRCQFGINILPAFRGGESTLIFYQLLRVYKQYFGAERFVVKPYQFGKNNKEALESGAFWFYYKAGFRPVDDAAKKLASDEWEKINNNSNYRTPIKVLKKFIASNLQLTFKENTFPHYDAAELSKYISTFINNQFEGKRDIAVTRCIRKTTLQLGIQSIKSWSPYEEKALNEWSLIAQAVLHIENWSSGAKEKVIKLIKAKGDAPEKKFIRLLQQHKEFWGDTEKLIASLL